MLRHCLISFFKVFNLRQFVLRILSGGVFMPVRIGDFVEAMSVGPRRVKRQGLITNIYGDGTFLVEMGAVLVLCQDPKKIPEGKLNRLQRDWVLRRRATLDPVDPMAQHRAAKPTPSFAP
jgi:hypothetical protein